VIINFVGRIRQGEKGELGLLGYLSSVGVDVIGKKEGKLGSQRSTPRGKRLKIRGGFVKKLLSLGLEGGKLCRSKNQLGGSFKGWIRTVGLEGPKENVGINTGRRTRVP